MFLLVQKREVNSLYFLRKWVSQANLPWQFNFCCTNVQFLYPLTWLEQPSHPRVRFECHIIVDVVSDPKGLSSVQSCWVQQHSIWRLCLCTMSGHCCEMLLIRIRVVMRNRGRIVQIFIRRCIVGLAFCYSLRFGFCRYRLFVFYCWDWTDWRSSPWLGERGDKTTNKRSINLPLQPYLLPYHNIALPFR